MNDPYQTLNVPRDASEAEIKQAHRMRAKATHPDRDGGNEEEFKSVAAAYALLSDPAARAHYDREGKAPLPEQRVSPAEQLILNTLNSSVLATGDLDDVLGTLAKAITAALKRHRSNLDAAVEGELAASEQLGRFRLDGEPATEENLLEGAFRNLVTNAQRVQASEREAIRVHTEALELLEGYEDTRPVVKEVDGMHFYPRAPFGSGFFHRDGRGRDGSKKGGW